MAKIVGMMDIGKRSMMNSKAALHTVGHNIANKETEGFSRQRVELQTNEPHGIGNLRMGTGAKPVKVTRVNNPHLERQIAQEKSKLGYLDGQSDAMVRVEQVYNEQLVEGLNSSISKFFNAVRELTANPENMAARTHMAESGKVLASDFHRTYNSLKDIRRDLDERAKTEVMGINEITREIASLNEKIQAVELSGAHANDERDRRDLLIKKLGEKINIRWAEGDGGQVTITAGNTAVLVSGYEAKELTVAGTPARGAKAEGGADIFYKNTKDSTPIVITDQLKSGALGGILSIRDEFMHGLMEGLNDMARTLSQNVNEIHRVGYNAYDQTGIDFFHVKETNEGAAATMEVNRAILDDAAKIATAGQPGAPGDNRIVNAISDLQMRKIMNDGQAGIDEFYQALVGRVGVVTNRIQNEHETQSNMIKQLNNIRESISGVSLDEETTKMIEYQKAFDASAQLIRAADEMLETIISLKR
jgi:flagellar hook-associated protein 1 FlgK